jgi:integrase
MSNVVPLLREEVAPKRQTPLRKPNAELRTREHLTEREVEKLIEAAKSNRHGHRDATMILVAYRHGLRASEVCDLRWDQVHFTSANLDVRRRKAGTPATHHRTAGSAPVEA